MKLTWPSEPATSPTEMRMKDFPLILGFCFFIVSGTLALYGTCAEAFNHHDPARGREAFEIHCPDALPLSNIQPIATIQSHSRNLSNVMPSIDEKLDHVVLVGRFKDYPFREPISQQDLFRFEEVFRL